MKVDNHEITIYDSNENIHLIVNRNEFIQDYYSLEHIDNTQYSQDEEDDETSSEDSVSKPSGRLPALKLTGTGIPFI